MHDCLPFSPLVLDPEDRMDVLAHSPPHSVSPSGLLTPPDPLQGEIPRNTATQEEEQQHLYANMPPFREQESRESDQFAGMSFFLLHNDLPFSS